MVRKDQQDRQHIFRSLLEAVNFIQSESVTLLGAYTKTNEHGQMRIVLNKYELPGPMRLQAFISREWDIDTGWIKWQYEI